MASTNSINLEGSVEFGGHLAWTLDKDGFTPIEIRIAYINYQMKCNARNSWIIW